MYLLIFSIIGQFFLNLETLKSSVLWGSKVFKEQEDSRSLFQNR